jgi:hypothetical protein
VVNVASHRSGQVTSLHLNHSGGRINGIPGFPLDHWQGRKEARGGHTVASPEIFVSSDENYSVVGVRVGILGSLMSPRPDPGFGFQGSGAAWDCQGNAGKDRDTPQSVRAESRTLCHLLEMGYCTSNQIYS